MPLNTIQFSETELTDLFRTSLIGTKDIADQKSEKKTGPWKFFGENKKQILFVTDYKSVVHIPDQTLRFLTRILAACNMDLGDIALINFKHYKETLLDERLRFFGPEIVLLFGLDPESFGLPIKFPPFQVQEYNRVRYLFSPPLEQFENNKDLKQSLWVSLKKIFSE
jgi:hypothetical protein